jgi:hypothetical protein
MKLDTYDIEKEEKASVVYRDRQVTLENVFLEKGERYDVQIENGKAKSVTIVAGYGHWAINRTTIEMKPGRVVDFDTYSRRERCELIATSQYGMRFLVTTVRYIAD